MKGLIGFIVLIIVFSLFGWWSASQHYKPEVEEQCRNQWGHKKPPWFCDERELTNDDREPQ